jgi:hypothetical protein
VTQYRFGTKTADFHVCLTCGAIPIVTCMIEGIRYAVFNVNTFDDVDRSELVETATNFDGETTESRLAGGGATGRQRQSAARGKTDCETSGWVIRVDLVSGVSPLNPQKLDILDAPFIRREVPTVDIDHLPACNDLM